MYFNIDCEAKVWISSVVIEASSESDAQEKLIEAIKQALDNFSNVDIDSAIDVRDVVLKDVDTEKVGGTFTVRTTRIKYYGDEEIIKNLPQHVTVTVEVKTGWDIDGLINDAIWEKINCVADVQEVEYEIIDEH